MRARVLHYYIPPYHSRKTPVYISYLVVYESLLALDVGCVRLPDSE